MNHDDFDRMKPLDRIFEDQTKAFKSGNDTFDKKEWKTMMSEIDYDAGERRRGKMKIRQ